MFCKYRTLKMQDLKLVCRTKEWWKLKICGEKNIDNKKGKILMIIQLNNKTVEIQT